MKFYSSFVVTFLILVLTYVSDKSKDGFHSDSNNTNNALYSGLGIMSSLIQDKKDLGIGPVKKLELGPVDNKMVLTGKALFNNKCLICHDMNQRKIGPPLGNILDQRTPEFIMNLMLNTVEMQKEDPVVKELIATYKVPMTPPYFTMTQARAVLEYLRSVHK